MNEPKLIWSWENYSDLRTIPSWFAKVIGIVGILIAVALTAIVLAPFLNATASTVIAVAIVVFVGVIIFKAKQKDSEGGNRQSIKIYEDSIRYQIGALDQRYLLRDIELNSFRIDEVMFIKSLSFRLINKQMNIKVPLIGMSRNSLTKFQSTLATLIELEK